MQLSFAPDGSWLQPQWLAHPEVDKKMREVLKRIEADPDLRARRDAIVARQREEWHGREARRKLVD
jgi:hypothetical protein